LAIEAAGKRAGLARKEIATVTAVIDANGTGSDFEIGPGVDFSIPIFHQNQGGKAIADAQLEQSLRRYITLRQQIRLEVLQARVRAGQALEVLRTWDDQVQPPLEETVQMARKGVESGDLPPTQALEAERVLLAATQNRLLANADWERARAELERAIAHRLDLVPDPTKPSPVVTP
jgi:outer membrane protein TolC